MFFDQNRHKIKDSRETDIANFFSASRSIFSQILSPNGRDQPWFWSIFRFCDFGILSKNQFFPRFCVKVALPKFSLLNKPVRMQNIRSNGWNYGGLVTKMGYRLVKKTIWDYRQGELPLTENTLQVISDDDGDDDD